MTAILDGIRVLDLSQFLSGPRATQLLSDFGAEVIKIEPQAGEAMRMMMRLVPGAERIMSILHRNKRGLGLDIRAEKGREVFRALVSKSDVVVENFVPGTMEKLGLGYEALREINPGLVYAAISGFGRSGPGAGKPAFDIIAQATAGIMHCQGTPHRPPAVPFADLVSGAYCAVGIMAALIHRMKTGSGQLLDISMQEVMFHHHFQALSDLALKPVLGELDAALGRSALDMLTDWKDPLAFWNSYRAKDGYVAIVAITDGQWQGLVEALGLPELADEEKYGNFLVRVQNSRAVRSVIEQWVAARSVREVVEKFAGHGVPCGRVNEREALPADENLQARGAITSVNHPEFGEVEVPENPIRLSETPAQVATPGPDIGQHTDEILGKVLGMEDAQIARLRDQGVAY